MVKWKWAQGRYAGKYEHQLDKSPGFIQRPTFFSRTVDDDKVGHPTLTEIPISRCTILLDAYLHVRTENAHMIIDRKLVVGQVTKM